MEIIETAPVEEVELKRKIEFCEICDLPSTEVNPFTCDKTECELCQLTFDKFVCTVCIHTKSLEEMEKIYIAKTSHEEGEKKQVESGIVEDLTPSTSPDVTTESSELVEGSEVEEEEEARKPLDSGWVEYSILATREYVRERLPVEDPAVERRIPLCGDDTEAAEEKGEAKENLLKVVKAISELNSEQDRLICSVDAENGDVVEVLRSLSRQNGLIDEKVTETLLVPEVERLEYKGEIAIEKEKKFFNEETETAIAEEELIAEEEKIQKTINQTEVFYYEDYQEDSGNESDVFVESDHTPKVDHSDEILEKIPEDDESASVLAESLVQDTLIASKSYAKILEHQDSMISNASIDKYIEERDFTHRANHFIRGTSLEHPEETSKAIEPEDFVEVTRPLTRANSISSFSSDDDDDDSSEGSEYENEYYPLYDHIKNQKIVNRDIRLLRSVLEEKFKIKIYGCEIEEIVRVKEEVLNRFGIDLGYHQVYNYMEKNELKKRQEEGIKVAIEFFRKRGLEMIETTKEDEVSRLEDQDLDERIQKICEYVKNDKTIDDLDDDEISTEAAKIATKFIESTDDVKSEERRTWRQKQADIIDLMEEYRRKCNKVRFEEENEQVLRPQTPVCLRTTPVSNEAKAIQEDVERVRRSFGDSHDIKVNAMIQITDDMREKIAKLAEEFPGKIRFEIETIPKAATKLMTSFKEDLIEDVSAATNFIEKTPIVQEKFDFSNFFRNIFKLKTNTTGTA